MYSPGWKRSRKSNNPHIKIAFLGQRAVQVSHHENSVSCLLRDWSLLVVVILLLTVYPRKGYAQQIIVYLINVQNSLL